MLASTVECSQKSHFVADKVRVSVTSTNRATVKLLFKQTRQHRTHKVSVHRTLCWLCKAFQRQQLNKLHALINFAPFTFIYA